MTNSSTIAIRPAAAADDQALRTLAELDSARPLRRPAVLAVVDGRPLAALSLADGRIVADPFRPSADVVALLRAGTPVGATVGRPRRRITPRLPRLRPAI
jgi:hypothetical protein